MRYNKKKSLIHIFYIVINILDVVSMKFCSIFFAYYFILTMFYAMIKISSQKSEGGYFRLSILPDDSFYKVQGIGFVLKLIFCNQSEKYLCINLNIYKFLMAIKLYR